MGSSNTKMTSDDRKANNLKRQLEFARELVLKGNLYRGYVEIARAYANVIEDVDQEALCETLAELRPSETAINSILTGMESSLAYIDRILSIGENFEPEELLLILLKRQDINLVSVLLKEHYNQYVEFDSSRTDEAIWHRFKHSSNRHNNKIFQDLYGKEVAE